jgi:hypothetical protein
MVNDGESGHLKVTTRRSLGGHINPTEKLFPFVPQSFT